MKGLWPYGFECCLARCLGRAVLGAGCCLGRCLACCLGLGRGERACLELWLCGKSGQGSFFCSSAAWAAWACSCCPGACLLALVPVALAKNSTNDNALSWTTCPSRSVSRKRMCLRVMGPLTAMKSRHWSRSQRWRPRSSQHVVPRLPNTRLALASWAQRR